MNISKEEIEDYFFQLCFGLQTSAWMLLGKIANPMSGAIEKNLEGAKATIDTLIMLKEKTKGNLTNEEEEFLKKAIEQLQINYVAEIEKEKNKKSPEEENKEAQKGNNKE